MEHGQVPDAGLSRHHPGLPRRQVIAVPRLFGVDVEVGRFSVKHVRMLCKSDNFSLVVVIVAGIHHVGQLLALGDR